MEWTCEMKYYYEKPEKWDRNGWQIYRCDHPMFNRCTLYLDEHGKGLGIVQKRYNAINKNLWWGSLDTWLASDIYHHNNFWKVFNELAAEKDENGLYPAIDVRSMMWRLRMKPLKKEYWEEEI